MKKLILLIIIVAFAFSSCARRAAQGINSQDKNGVNANCIYR